MKKRSEYKNETTVSPVYFDPSATTNIILAENNIGFYEQLVQQFGSNSSNKHLWPGETLFSFIQTIKKQCRGLKNQEERKRVAKLIKKYKTLYKTLINN